ncbi:MAG: hypothetical protein EOS78_02690 [Mesorhizobium sp.]|nr:hypothetical protein EJ077_08165 [Mesorhizobium sp. M8A.F.Ca.ET.057.01.1.1]RWE43298.1 MAG: hypothetical protein EOS80_23805 [Mesorhizobium sp.]RWE44494.1 MAG: hypothetical protein EOS78_02690 [Mesorhizobium sp.]TJX79770.1 MAG: hypothetical protein E5W21_01670 [Mesorhizobium sp.]
MNEDFTPRQSRRGRYRVFAWSIPVIALIFVCLIAFFVFAPMSNGSWHTAPFKRAPVQNQGGDAPANTSPPPGVKKSPQENTEMPDAH